MKKTILLLTTQSKGISASQIRMKYFRQALEKCNYNIVNFEISLNGLKKYLYYFYRFPPKDLATKSKNADLILTTSPTLLNAILAYKVAKKRNIPFIVDIRDIWEEYAKTAHFLFYKVGVIKGIVREYYEALTHATKIFVVTEHMKRYYENIVGLADKLIVISNGTDTDIIRCRETKREVDLICLADLNRPYHNLEFLLEALKGNNLRLCIVGGGSFLPKIKKKAQDLGINEKVIFVGWVPYENLASYLCRAKVGVVGRPFIYNVEYLYTIPVKTYDYLAAGLPVIAYGPENSALEAFIKQNALGCYISKPDPSVLSKELNVIVEKSDQLREKARRISLRFDRKNIAKKVVEIIDEIFA